MADALLGLVRVGQWGETARTRARCSICRLSSSSILLRRFFGAGALFIVV